MGCIIYFICILILSCRKRFSN